VIDWTLDGISLAACGTCRSIGLPIAGFERLSNCGKTARDVYVAAACSRLRYLVDLFWI